MKIRQTEAIVLNTNDYGESDRLVAFYTMEEGKVKGIAKGARRSRKRFVHTFEPFSRVELTYKERKSLVWIEACKLIEPHLALRTEIERWAYAALATEAILEMAPEGERQEDLFFLACETLSRLCTDRNSLNVVLLFLVRFLDAMGYLPALKACQTCGRPLKDGQLWWWRVAEGKLLCPEHCSVRAYDLRLDVGTLLLLLQARELPIEKIWRLHIAQERKLPLLHALTGWIRGQIRRDLKSLRLLDQVQSAPTILSGKEVDQRSPELLQMI